MKLGPLTISLTVADIGVSLAFYRSLGFEILDGVQDEGWLILRNGAATIGIFQGKFDRNIITFNPRDVRSIQAELLAQGVELIEPADPDTTGAAHITMIDPDGNPILMDQFDEEYMDRHGLG